MERLNQITHAVIGAAIEVHRCLGPGLLESVYLEALCCELADRHVPFVRQMEVPLRYKGRLLGSVYRVDLVVADSVAVELKAVEALLAVHHAQLLTYLKLLSMPVGLLVNFNVPHLASGLRRIVYRL